MMMIKRLLLGSLMGVSGIAAACGETPLPNVSSLPDESLQEQCENAGNIWWPDNICTTPCENENNKVKYKYDTSDKSVKKCMMKWENDGSAKYYAGCYSDDDEKNIKFIEKYNKENKIVEHKNTIEDCLWFDGEDGVLRIDPFEKDLTVHDDCDDDYNHCFVKYNHDGFGNNHPTDLKENVYFMIQRTCAQEESGTLQIKRCPSGCNDDWTACESI